MVSESDDSLQCPRTIAITGATGFLGQHLTRFLMQYPNISVRLLIHRSPAKALEPDDRISLFQGNLLDARSLTEFVQPGDDVVHLAYLRQASTAENLQCAANLAEVCLAGRARSLIHCSTAEVIGKCRDRVVRESTTCQPVTPYQISKLAIEQLLLDRCRPAVPVTVLRPTVVFGPEGQNLMKLARSATQGNPLWNFLYQSLQGTRRMNAVGVENVVGAIGHLIQHTKALDGQTFFISDDEYPENNYRDMVAYLNRRLRHRETKLPCLPVPPQILSGLLRLTGRSTRDPRQTWDCSRLLQTGFTKPATFEQSLARFADWYEQTHGRQSRKASSQSCGS